LTPKELGYHFPAEWEKHRATWLSWPHKEASWPGKIKSIYPRYAEFIKIISEGERVCINVANSAMQVEATQWLRKSGVDLGQIDFYHHPTNDAWCRDHGPAFVVNRRENKKAVVDWGYNAWGDKYPPYDLDDVIPTLVAKALNIPVFNPGIVMEGGSVEFNGKGTLMTTRACLLNPNRNPNLNQADIERYLSEFYGANHIIWIGDGIVGDDTDGHIDDLTRFVNSDTVVTVVEESKKDENYELLQENLKELGKLRLETGKQINIVELPMPKAIIYEDQRLPASYANFYISNNAVVVPTFQDKFTDERALVILESLFPDRKVVGIDSTDIIWGLGSFHCLSQQEPV
jgi:agmatine deiminase